MATTAAQAIGDYWDSRADLTTLFPGGMLYAGEAPDVVDAMPYAVLIEVSTPTEGYTTANRLIRATYQISCMADNLDQAESLAQAVARIYDRATLVMTGGDILHCLAGDTHWTLGVGLGLGGQDCWVCYTEIEILMVR